MKIILLTENNVMLADGDILYEENNIDFHFTGKVLVNETTDKETHEQFTKMTMIEELLRLLHAEGKNE